MPKCNHGCTVASSGCIDATTQSLDFKGLKILISRLCNRHATRTLAVACIPPVFRRGGMQPMARVYEKCGRKFQGSDSEIA